MQKNKDVTLEELLTLEKAARLIKDRYLETSRGYGNAIIDTDSNEKYKQYFNLHNNILNKIENFLADVG